MRSINHLKKAALSVLCALAACAALCAPMGAGQALAQTDPVEIPPFYEVKGASGETGLLSAEGEWVYPCEYDGFSMVRDVVTGALTHVAMRSGSRYALGTTEGEPLTEPRFDRIEGTWNGKFLLTASEGGNQQMLWRLGGTGAQARSVPVSEGAAGFTQSGMYRHTILSRDDLGSVSAWRLEYLDDELNPLWARDNAYCEGLTEGLLCVRQELPGAQALYGFLDEAGREAIPFAFARAEPFSEGVALVEADARNVTNKRGKTTRVGTYRFIDKGGAYCVVAPQYKTNRFRLTSFKDGYAELFDGKEGKVYRIDRAGRRERVKVAEPIRINRKGNAIYTDAKGRKRVLMKGRCQITHLSEEVCLVEKMDDGRSTSAALFDLGAGKWAIKPGAYARIERQYVDWRAYGSWDSATAGVVIAEAASGKRDVVALSGKVLLSGLDEVESADGRRAVGVKDGVYGLLDMSGRFLWKRE